MDPTLLKRVSKQMALLLRHAPESAGLVLDPEGFVHIDDLVDALRRGDIGDIDAETVRGLLGRSNRANNAIPSSMTASGRTTATPPPIASRMRPQSRPTCWCTGQADWSSRQS